jgi:hypothetical protein
MTDSDRTLGLRTRREIFKKHDRPSDLASTQVPAIQRWPIDTSLEKRVGERCAVVSDIGCT